MDFRRAGESLHLSGVRQLSQDHRYHFRPPQVRSWLRPLPHEVAAMPAELLGGD